MDIQKLKKKFTKTRKHSERICASLAVEDYSTQPIEIVSPPKWHLGHTTWFYETFILNDFLEGYQSFHEDYGFLFNSYYEAAGKRVARFRRGDLTRPTVQEVIDYRKYIDESMITLLSSGDIPDRVLELTELGINHEEQHQELLLTDIKYILGNNPLHPAYGDFTAELTREKEDSGWIIINEGLYETGHSGRGFCYDNELSSHKVYLNAFSISEKLVTNREFINFIEAGGYEDPSYWHAEGWDWVRKNHIQGPLYWQKEKGKWKHYTLGGLKDLDLSLPLCHVSFYEAAAFAEFAGKRLPTEAEWETSSEKFSWGLRWEWTNSAYLPYPGYRKAPGAVGEYNGKFMVNQMVLRGASIATPEGHSRKTYRNFFHPWERWQFTGIRLVK